MADEAEEGEANANGDASFEVKEEGNEEDDKHEGEFLETTDADKKH